MCNFRCFKYRAVNKYLIDSLVNSTLYFASRDALNDPFDSKINIEEVITSLLGEDLPNRTRSALERIRHDRQFFQKFDAGYKDFGICSFSIELAEILMWSHYADQHRGVALHYDFPMEVLDNPSEIFGVAPVKYETDTVSDWIRTNAYLFDDDHFVFVTDLLKQVLTAKAPAWAYECEGRIIRPTAGPYAVSRSTLTGITFGLRTEPSDESLIRSIAGRYFDGIKFSRVVRSGSDFGIRIDDAS